MMNLHPYVDSWGNWHHAILWWQSICKQRTNNFSCIISVERSKERLLWSITTVVCSIKVYFNFTVGKTVVFFRSTSWCRWPNHTVVCGQNVYGFCLSAAKKVGWSEERLHKEHFSAAPIENNSNLAFWGWKLPSTGATLPIPEDRSVFWSVRRSWYWYQRVLRKGICGSCLTKVISRHPDHRSVFIRKEHADNNVFNALVVLAHCQTHWCLT